MKKRTHLKVEDTRIVRTMQRTGKLKNTNEEKKKMSTNIMGLDEVRWTEKAI